MRTPREFDRQVTVGIPLTRNATRCGERRERHNSTRFGIAHDRSTRRSAMLT
jgi:hypothetical protein